MTGSNRRSGDPWESQQLAEILRGQIASGVYRPGDKLPSERTLSNDHGMVRNTVRAALIILIGEGLVVSEHGRGYFVRSFRPIVRNSIARVATRQWQAGKSIWDADNDGRAMVVDHIDVTTDQGAPPDVAALFGDDFQDKVCIRARRYAVDGKPVLYATSYLPASLVAGTPITHTDPGPGGIYARLADLGRAPVAFREDVRATMPSADETRDLDIPPGTPVIRITRTAADANGLPVEINHMTMDASAFVIRYDFDA